MVISANLSGVQTDLPNLQAVKPDLLRALARTDFNWLPKNRGSPTDVTTHFSQRQSVKLRIEISTCCRVMFSNIGSGTGVTTTLICGPPEVTETFMFEGAMHWAREGQRVIYVTPNPIESLPPKYHDGSQPRTDIFQLVKFMYLQDYKSLMEVLLVELDTFNALPSALIIDRLENYTRSETLSMGVPREDEILVAKTCSVIIDAMNACSRILTKKVHVLATVRPESLAKVHFIYFDNIWHLSIDKKDNDGTESGIITLKKTPCTINDQSFEFLILEDRTIVLKQILQNLMN